MHNSSAHISERSSNHKLHGKGLRPNCMEKLDSSVDMIIDKSRKLHHQLDEDEKRFLELQINLKRLREKSEEVCTSHSKLESKIYCLNFNTKMLETSIESLLQKREHCNDISNDGTLIWKIRDVQRRIGKLTQYFKTYVDAE